jgi:hypothetical protein
MARTELPLCLLLAQIDRKKSELAGFVIENLPEEAKQQFRQRYEEMKAEGVALAAGRRRSQVLKVPARRSHPRSADPARQPLTKTSFPAITISLLAGMLDSATAFSIAVASSGRLWRRACKCSKSDEC